MTGHERATRAIEAWFIDHDGEEIDFAELARLALEASGIEQLQRENEELRKALEGIHEARLRNGKDVGYGWNITKLNRAMNASLPLIGREVPQLPRVEAALREQGRSVRVEDLTEEDVEAIRTAKPREQGEG